MKDTQKDVKSLGMCSHLVLLFGHLYSFLGSVNTEVLNLLGNDNNGDDGKTSRCFEETRKEILDQIDVWIDNRDSPERVMWILGMAGKGKSTIATTVYDRCKTKGNASCSIFYYRRGRRDLDRRVILALARQLAADGTSDAGRCVLENIRKAKEIQKQSIQQQFSALILDALRARPDAAVPAVLIVDALDECNDAKEVTDVLELLESHSRSLPRCVRFIITSRPEDRLVRCVSRCPIRTLDLDTVSESTVNTDIERYVKHGLGKIAREHNLQDGLMKLDDASELAKRSQGSFQWARTVISFCSDGDPLGRLREVLDSPSEFDGLDKLYQQIFIGALSAANNRKGARSLLLRTLQVLVVAVGPVSLQTLNYLLAEHEARKTASTDPVSRCLRHEVLTHLTSLLSIPASPEEPIRLMHVSIRDFLTDHTRCEGDLFVDVAIHHSNLARDCLQLMGRDLKYNICELQDASKPISELQGSINQFVPAGLKYCCRAWPAHLAVAWPQRTSESRETTDAELQTFLTQFSENKLLAWLEVMSLTEAVDEAVGMVIQINQLLAVSWCEHSFSTLLILSVSTRTTSWMTRY